MVTLVILLALFPVAIAGTLTQIKIHVFPTDGFSPPKHYANCQTTFVVYLLQCECGCYYVGKTIQKLCKRLYRHIAVMKTKNPDFPLGRHAALVHSEHFPKVSVLVLDRLHQTPRGGDLNKLLLQWEMRWILNLNATSPKRLNEILSFKPFLQGFTSGGYEGDL